MDFLTVRFRYCYGIKSLEFKFDFKSKNTFAIYAPNGSMKTSFAKTFKDFMEGQDTRDLVFPSRKTTREISSDTKIEPENIFIIEPYVESYQSDKMSTLLASKGLKSEYDKIHKDIDKLKKELIKKLKRLTGLTGHKHNIEKKVEAAFDKPFFEAISDYESLIKSKKELLYNDIQYSIIFNEKVRELLQSEEIRKSITQYIEKYNELIEKSPYLRKNFNFYHAENVYKHLSSNNFFKAGHSVNLSDGKTKKEYKSEEELKKLLDSEKERVLENEELQKKFDDIDRKLLKNADLRTFRDYLLDHREILPELVDLKEFEKKIWLAYFVNQKDLTLRLIEKYKQGHQKIKELIEKARKERTDWDEVVKIFNMRFSHLPFYLTVKNKEDVILKGDVPSVEFVFKDEESENRFSNQDELIRVLSVGEKRALYLLNIIFEVEARKKENKTILFIIDDIADSFDYKNKYAIVEYLKHIANTDKFYMIILTHNFDFYRTIQSRGIVSYDHCLISIREKDKITLEKAKYINNPFINDWKNNLDDTKKLIASIPFVRNIIEYTQSQKNQDYLSLTAVLHMKKNSKDLKIRDLKEIFEKYIKDISFPDKNLDKPVINMIYETAEECLDVPEGINLENRIVLSIATRLKAEEFLIENIKDKDFLNNLENEGNQTWKLVKKYHQEFPENKKIIELLQRILLMTPENIHVNSFMYEPLIDMGDWELKEL